MTRDTIVENLRNALPQFPINSQNADNTYLVVNDLGRYICQRATCSDYDETDTKEIVKALCFLEKAIVEGDAEIRDLVHECLETLASCIHLEKIKIHFGPRVLELWQKIS